MLPAITFCCAFRLFIPAENRIYRSGLQCLPGTTTVLVTPESQVSSQFASTLAAVDEFDWLRSFTGLKRTVPLAFGAGKTGTPEFYADEQQRSLRRKFREIWCRLRSYYLHQGRDRQAVKLYCVVVSSATGKRFVFPWLKVQVE